MISPEGRRPTEDAELFKFSGGFCLFISELQHVLKGKFALPRHLINDFIRLVREDPILCRPGDPPAIGLKDNDLGILPAAASNQVNVLVTGDRELHIVGKVAELKTMSPRQFLKEFTEE